MILTTESHISSLKENDLWHVTVERTLEQQLVKITYISYISDKVILSHNYNYA